MSAASFGSVISAVLLALSVAGAGDVDSVGCGAPSCACAMEGRFKARCLGLNSTIGIEHSLTSEVKEVHIEGGRLDVLDLSDFASLTDLEALSVTGSGVRKLMTGSSQPPRLRALDLSGNELTTLEGSTGQQLQRLDLSSNRLDENLDPEFLQSLPKSLQKLDISDNVWACSPKLAWMHRWAEPLLARSVFSNLAETRCRYHRTHQSGPLLLLMRYYSEQVLPSCPHADGCSCVVTKVQEGEVAPGVDRVYSVAVECAGAGLNHFPKLPRNARAVDLTGNSLDASSFSRLSVSADNYADVESLRLDDNGLEELPEKLLDMRLNWAFSARNNKLTLLPYDFSQRLILNTDSVELAGNPWICSCGSQITDLNLLSKVRDKRDLTCGPGSDKGLLDKKISSLDPRALCPPDGDAATFGPFSFDRRELFLRLLCFLLAAASAAVLTRLAYDYWVYRTRGQLPWIALKMP